MSGPRPDPSTDRIVRVHPKPTPGPSDPTVHGLFAIQAAVSPEKIAVRCGSASQTYAQLASASGDIARRLQTLGVAPGSLVGLFLERSVSLPSALLGILQTGAAYVPMDPAFPAERLRMMAEDATLAAIITQTSLADRLPAHQARVLFLDEPTTTSLPASPDPGQARPSPLPTPESPRLAYVIFTSGSTGRPKGVQITHRSFVNFLQSMRREPGCCANDILLSVTTLSFDIAGLELMLPLATGATVAIAPREIASDAELLSAEINRTGATVMQATPVTWRMLLAYGWNGSPRLKVLVGGESVPRDLVNQLAPRCASLWNMYGPTETTIWSTTGRLETGDGPVSIGRPIDNTQIYIVDPQLNPLPPGSQGEILIGGEGVADGYLGRPDLTASRFIPDPFSPLPGARLYRTGDLGMCLPDGSLRCLGRLDDQIKIRGYRIELGDIETCLRAHPGVEAAAVAPHDPGSGDLRLVAYLVPRGKQPPELDPATLRQHVRDHLPEYMVPTVWVTLHQLPLTPNGKLDRKALPPPGASSSPLAARHVAPETEDERTMLRLWQETLHLSQIGMTDGFFDLGGNSLLAVRLFAGIERTFGRKLPLATLLRHATPAALLRQITSPTASPWNSLVSIQPGSADRLPLFCVHGAGGNLLLYRELAASLGPDVPFLGFQSRGLDGQSDPHETVEAMASAYVEELLAVRPSGPYLLGGYCMGGTVAYEMARQLAARNHPVPLLVLFDTYNFAARIPSRGALDRVHRLGQKVVFHFSNLLRAGNRGRWEYFVSKLRLVRDQAQRWRQNPGPSRPPGNTPGKGLSIESINHEAGMNYQPVPTPVKLIVFKPERSYADYPDPRMGWEPFAKGGLEIVELPLNPHAMLVDPYVQHLARALRQRLEAVWNHQPPPNQGTRKQTQSPS